MAAAVPVGIVRLVDFSRWELQDFFDGTILVVGIGIETGQLWGETVVELRGTGRDVQLERACKHTINTETCHNQPQDNCSHPVNVFITSPALVRLSYSCGQILGPEQLARF